MAPAFARTRPFVAAAALLAVVATAPAAAQRLDEAVLRVPVAPGPDAGAPTQAIDVTVFRPAGPGPHPIVVLSHGSPRVASDRRRAGRIRFEAQSRAFVAMGYAVVVPTRRGYGDSQGDWAETYGSCEAPDYFRAGLESARDIESAVTAARALPDLDGARIVLAGQSAGGFGSVAASTLAMPGVMAIVNFAGGRGSRGPDDVCGVDRLVEAMQRYGRAAVAVPQLWIYSRNDHYFGPDLARRLHAAFVGAGGRAQFLEAPAVGGDGHNYFGHVADWAPRVQGFLAEAARPEPVMRAGAPAAVR